MGFETLAALKVIEMQKRMSNDLDLYIVSTYHKNEKELWFKNWNKKDLETYEYIKKNARKEYVAISKSDGNSLGAHKDIIDLSTYVLVAFNGMDLGATPGAVAYSILKNKEIIYLDINKKKT